LAFQKGKDEVTQILSIIHHSRVAC
jgi:hypothetical protein